MEIAVYFFCKVNTREHFEKLLQCLSAIRVEFPRVCSRYFLALTAAELRAT